MVTMVVYAPEGARLTESTVVQRLDKHFESWPESQVQLRPQSGTFKVPCVLVTVTDSESAAFV